MYFHMQLEKHTGREDTRFRDVPNNCGLYFVSKDALIRVLASGAGGMPARGHGLLAQTVVPSFLGHVSKGPRVSEHHFKYKMCQIYWEYIFSYNHYKLKQLMLKNRIFSE